jgi:hypothetical protein
MSPGEHPIWLGLGLPPNPNANPTQARALFTELFSRARRAHAMVAYEQDFVADNTLRFGWLRQL